MSLRLIIEDFEGDRMVVPLPEDEGPLTLGRGADNHVRLPERNVSRRHARLSYVDQSWRIRDTDSYNGIRVNGETIEDERELSVGDFVQLGNYQLLLGSQARPLEEDVAALASASAQHQRQNSDPYDDADMFGLLSSGFPTAVDPLSHSSGDIDYEVQAPEDSISAPKGKRALWSLGLGAAVTIAVVLAWNLGRHSGEAKLSPNVGLSRTKDALASAAVPGAKSQSAQAQGSAKQPSLDGSRQGEGHDSASPSGPKGSGSDHPGKGPLAVKAGQAGTDAAGPGTSDSPGVPGTQDAGPVLAGGAEQGAAGGPQASPPTAKASPKRRGDRPPKDPARQAEQAKQWVKRARKAAMAGRHQEAMSLARRSFRAQPSQEALQVMGLSACKLQRRKQAQFAYQRMRRDDSRRALKGICSLSGIDL